MHLLNLDLHITETYDIWLMNLVHLLNLVSELQFHSLFRKDIISLILWLNETPWCMNTHISTHIIFFYLCVDRHLDLLL